VIAGFRHRGLKRFFSGDERKIEASLRERVRDILSLLDVCTSTAELGAPAYRLDPLKGYLLGYWSMTVSGNWRIVFRFDNQDNVTDVDLVDYH
jgi:proteic killer suppression protein